MYQTSPPLQTIQRKQKQREKRQRESTSVIQQIPPEKPTFFRNNKRVRTRKMARSFDIIIFVEGVDLSAYSYQLVKIIVYYDQCRP